ncbi:MAG: phospholipase D-like domain-containing protein [Bacteroidota bacterium]
MPKKIGNIEIYMGPSQIGSPDNLLNPIIDFIDGAQKNLNIAVQEIDNVDIAKAIIRAKSRKVRIRVVLEADYLISKKTGPDPFKSKGSTYEVNRELYNAILRSKIRVNSDFNPKIFHQKFITRDNTSVLTGSTNFTDNGVEKNLNHIIIVHDEKVTKSYNDEFKEIRNGHFGKFNIGHDRRPKEIEVSGVRVKTLFAPDHNPEMEIMKQIAKSQSHVDFAIFTFAKSSGIDDELVSVSRRGVNVRGAFYAMQANQDWSAKDTFKGSQAQLFLVPKKGLSNPKPRKLHHKIMVIDKQVIIAGSFNYTAPANLTNDENIIILGDLDARDPQEINRQKDLAKYVLDDIDRIIEDYGEVIVN